MANPHNLKIGQELLLVSRVRGGISTLRVEVATIGRKWFTIKDARFKERFSVDTLESDSQWSGHRRRCYLSQAHWDKEVQRGKAEAGLFKLFSGYSRPGLSHLSTEEIEEITAKLTGSKPKDTQ